MPVALRTSSLILLLVTFNCHTYCILDRMQKKVNSKKIQKIIWGRGIPAINLPSAHAWSTVATSVQANLTPLPNLSIKYRIALQILLAILCSPLCSNIFPTDVMLLSSTVTIMNVMKTLLLPFPNRIYLFALLQEAVMAIFTNTLFTSYIVKPLPIPIPLSQEQPRFGTLSLKNAFHLTKI